jgi:hypothetical protein
MADCPRRKHLT